jgi:hypothetical protein
MAVATRSAICRGIAEDVEELERLVLGQHLEPEEQYECRDAERGEGQLRGGTDASSQPFVPTEADCADVREPVLPRTTAILRPAAPANTYATRGKC